MTNITHNTHKAIITINQQNRFYYLYSDQPFFIVDYHPDLIKKNIFQTLDPLHQLQTFKPFFIQTQKLTSFYIDSILFTPIELVISAPKTLILSPQGYQKLTAHQFFQLANQNKSSAILTSLIGKTILFHKNTELENYFLSATIFLSQIKNETYFNQWYDEFLAEINGLDILVEFSNIDDVPTLRIEGQDSVNMDKIKQIQMRLKDIAKHYRNRFWVTEFIGFHEYLRDYCES